jgi:hypothetical protein
LSLLHQIQESVVQEGSDLGSILLKLRLLAARLGSDILEEWVKHESEGYPDTTDVPSYRIAGITYKGSFSGPFGSGIKNAPIPPYLIEKFASASWTNHEIRESISAIEELIRLSTESGGLGIDASNLILLLQGKIYEGYSCNEVKGTISRTAFYEIRQAVRSRILELTLELEKSIPAAAHITFGAQQKQETNHEKIQQISQQIIYGNVTTAVAGGSGSNISVNVEERDKSSFIEYLVASGITKSDASELAEIIATEEPISKEEPFGQKARNWIAANIQKAAAGSWKTGISVATSVLTAAALKYYGLK